MTDVLFSLSTILYLDEFAELKTVAEPNDILVPETVPTIAVAALLLEASSYTITTLVEDKAVMGFTEFRFVCPVSKVAMVPKLIEVPDIVPTAALPLLLFA